MEKYSDRAILFVLGFALIGYSMQSEVSNLWLIAGSCVLVLACKQ